jgi:hypothetical protein
VLEGGDIRALSVASGHLPDTSLPWHEGNTALAGHRDTFFSARRRRSARRFPTLTERAAEFSPERAGNPASRRQTELGNTQTRAEKPWTSSCTSPDQCHGVLADARGIPRAPFGSLSRRRAMLYTIAVILLILWLLGFVSGYTIGAFIHVLLVIALVLLLVQLLSGRRVV